MNPPPLQWCRRQAAFAAALGALVSLVGPARPAVATAHLPVLGSESTFPYDAIRASTGADRVGYDIRQGADDGTPSLSAMTARVPNHHVVQGETINVIIPRMEGWFVMTVSDEPVRLSTPALSADKETVELTGQLGAMTVIDGRYLSEPGWSVSGRVGDFSGGGHTVSGSYLGWTPVVTTQNADRDVTAGPAVIPGTDPGLKVGSLLAAAAATRGLGATVLDATLDLKVPAGSSLGSLSATLTVTLVTRA